LLIDDLVEHYKQELDLNYLEIRYEDLVEKQEPSVRKILEFIGVDFDPSILAFHENRRYARTASYAQVTEELYSHAVFRYRSYLEHLGQAAAILKPMLDRLNYSPD
jgi:hypothetical protein